jgi:hypothetical protein
MSMTDPKDSAIAAPGWFYVPVPARLPVDQVFHDAIVDVEKGVAFWKALVERRPPKRRTSSKLLNRADLRRIQ